MSEADSAPQDDREALAARIAELEARLEEREAADAAALGRRKAAADLAGEVATQAMIGPDVKRSGRNFWDAWEAYARAPRDKALPLAETRELAVSILARWTRVRLFYLLAVAVPSVFVFAQTVLLFQQNARFDRQNNLIAFEQTSNLRSLLFLPPRDSLRQPVSDYRAIPDSLLYASQLYAWPQPNRSTVDQTLAFSRREPEIAIDALLPLIRDDAPSVAVGALTVLGRLRALGLTDVKAAADRGRFYGANLSTLNLRLASLPSADLRSADLSGTDLTGSVLKGARLNGANLHEAGLEHTDLSYASLVDAEAIGASFYDADLSETRFDRGNFSLASFEGAWLRDNSFEGSILGLTNLSNTQLSGANFEGAYLISSNLSGATLNDAILENAVLTFANLDGARVNGADLSGADLRHVNLDGLVGLKQVASLRGAYVSRRWRHPTGDTHTSGTNSDEILEWAIANGAMTEAPPSEPVDPECCEPTNPGPGPPPRNPPKR